MFINEAERMLASIMTLYVALRWTRNRLLPGFVKVKAGERRVRGNNGGTRAKTGTEGPRSGVQEGVKMLAYAPGG